ncbi:MAG: flagellar biosynthetic protein FliR, partial [Candidatus Methylomirabilis sp.]|nr:flagellar biosynthetic protein FliR [Deltaproteobacteria bacterium]
MDGASPIVLDLDAFSAFLPLFLRVCGILALAPIFGEERLPPTSRVMLALMVAWAVYPAVAVRPPIPETMTGLTLGLGGELALGAAIGLTAKAVFGGVELAGQVAGSQGGLDFAHTVDPLTHQQRPVLSQFYYLLAMMLFLAADGHHLFLRALARSFVTIPLLSAGVDAELSRSLMSLGAGVFTLAIQIGAPLFGVMLLTNLMMGLLARTSPQFNIFSVGFIVLAGAVVILVWATLPYAVSAL